MQPDPLPTRRLPEYNPSLLVLRVQEVLARDGIAVVVDGLNAQTSVTAAADLLRALRVAPATTPQRYR